MIYYAFDLHPRLDPSAARLVRFSKLQAASYKAEANGTGRGSFSIRATDADAAFIDPDGLQYVRVVEINDAVVDGATLSGFGETVRGGFFTESGKYEVLTETSTKLLTWGGLGALSYLGRAVMDADSWINDPFIGTDPQPDGTWPLHLAGTGNEIGAILWRVLHELEEPGRHQDPVPLMSMGFTYLVDSNAAAWVQATGDFVAQVGDNVLDIIQRLMQMGLYIEVDPDTFEVNAYEPGTHRRDRTGGAWGASVVRLQSPTDATVPTGNIKSDAFRQLEAKVRRNAILTGSKDSWLWVDDPGVDVPWEGTFFVDDEAGTSLLKAGEAQLAARSDAGDVLRTRIKLGNDPSNGRYVPFDHIRLDDLVTVATGTGAWDYDEAEFPVAAIALELRQGGDWDAWADLGSSFLSMAERAFQAQPVGAHTHPPNPQLCRPLVGGSATIVDYGVGASTVAWSLTGTGTGAETLTITAGHVDRALYAFVLHRHDVAAPVVTWSVGAQSFGTRIATIAASFTTGNMSVYRLLNPTAGAGTVSATNAGQIGAFFLVAVDQAAPNGTVATNESSGTTSSLTITGTGLPIDAVGMMGANAASVVDPVPSGAQSQAWSESNDLGGGFDDNQFGGSWGDLTPAWSSMTPTFNWVAAGLSVNGIASGSGDGHAALIGTSIRAKRCDDTEHYHTTADPTVNDDTTLGFRNNTLWINETTGAMFLLLDNADGAADWLAIGGGTDLSGINFLVGTASGDLSAEIAVGTTPGGELGNTWASPTVDATHAGSNHLQPVRKNSAGTVFERRRLNLIEGSNVTLTVADDAGNDEVDITVASTGGSALTVQDEGTPLATDATTLNFVGAGVTATGAGATKTVTIPGGGGQILISDTPSTPLVFADLIQNEAQDDLVYAD